MFRWAVRTRPKVNHALCVRKSGEVSFSEAISPATEPRISQMIDDVRNAKAAARLDRSCSTLASSSAEPARFCKEVPSFCKEVPSGSSLATYCSAARSGAEMDGSSVTPTSPLANMTSEASDPALIKPFIWAQMNMKRPSTDMRKDSARSAPTVMVMSESLNLSRAYHGPSRYCALHLQRSCRVLRWPHPAAVYP